MPAVPEDRARTIGMCKRLGIWPLDSKHKPSGCACPRCFGDEVDELAPLRVKTRRVCLPWETDYEAA